MSIVEKAIEVHVPVHVAYNQWTQFEEFPKFMDGVVEVEQLDEKRLRWRANVGCARGDKSVSESGYRFTMGNHGPRV